MKRFLTVVFLALTFTQVSFASDNPFKMGILLTEGFTGSFNSDDEIGNMSGLMLSGNLPMEIAFNPSASLVINPGIEISCLDPDDESSRSSYYNQLSLIYVDFAIMIRYNISGGFFALGPQISLNTKASVNTKWSDEELSIINSKEFSVVISGGYRFHFGLELGTKINYALSSIFDTPYNDINVKRINFQFSVGYWFLH